MAYFLGFGDGILISVGIIFLAIFLIFVNGRSKGLTSIVTYILLGAMFLFILMVWPIKGQNEPVVDFNVKTDMIMIPRTLFLIFMPIFLIYLVNLYVRHNLFHSIWPKTTEHRHGQNWLQETKVRQMNRSRK